MNLRAYLKGTGTLIFALIAYGCLPNLTHSQNDNLPEPDVVPGRGITNQVELGMTLEEIKSRRTDLIVRQHDPASGPKPAKPYWVTIPSFGIDFSTLGTNVPITLINFNVDPKTGSNVFVGTISGNLRFEAGRQPKRQEVIRAFGAIPAFGKTNLSAARTLLERGEDAIVLGESGTEMLYYNSKGVMFDVRNGVVVRFSVMEMFKGVRSQ